MRCWLVALSLSRYALMPLLVPVNEPADGVEAVLAGRDPLVRAAPSAGAGKKDGPPVFDDHVQRVFRADAPNRVWPTDIREHRTSEGKLYCCVIKQVLSNRIVGYLISDRMTAELAGELCRPDMVGSMGGVGVAGGNAAMEGFWSPLQSNVLNQQRWSTRHHLCLAIVVWIERKYYRQRAQDTFSGLTPIEFETKPLTLAA